MKPDEEEVEESFENLNYSTPFDERPEGFEEERERIISAGPMTTPEEHNRFFDAYADKANQIRTNLMSSLMAGSVVYDRVEAEKLALTAERKKLEGDIRSVRAKLEAARALATSTTGKLERARLRAGDMEIVIKKKDEELASFGGAGGSQPSNKCVFSLKPRALDCFSEGKSAADVFC